MEARATRTGPAPVEKINPHRALLTTPSSATPATRRRTSVPSLSLAQRSTVPPAQGAELPRRTTLKTRCMSETAPLRKTSSVTPLIILMARRGQVQFAPAALSFVIKTGSLLGHQQPMQVNGQIPPPPPRVVQIPP